MDIALISAMITGGYEGNLKAAILAGIVLHIVLYMLSRKQVKLLIQAFKKNGVKEINNLFNMIYVFIIVIFYDLNSYKTYEILELKFLILLKVNKLI